jgi:glycosyltransferase involved in cell wall biosynthesis
VKVLPQTDDHAKELIEGAGLHQDVIEVFPNFLPDGAILSEKRTGPFSGSCVFVGQIKEEKGVFDIIAAIDGKPGMTCDFYGQILDRDRDRFFGMLGQCAQCHYRGMLEGGEIIGTISKYDALLLPTRHPGEGQPAVIIEAFAAGVPVITTKWKSIPELVGNGSRGMLVPVNSPGAILTALERLRDDATLVGSLTENAREYVKDVSESSLIGDKLIKLVSGAIRGG